MNEFDSIRITEFLSTPSARRATCALSDQEYKAVIISIHALREEGDMFLDEFDHIIKEFLSTPSARRATSSITVLFVHANISIHALREEGDFPMAEKQLYPVFISIHALREEGDPRPQPAPPTAMYFYPRPPRGGRPELKNLYMGEVEFLSTPSARRATAYTAAWNELQEKFLSTPSARRATVSVDRDRISLTISIHALREEGDPLAGFPFGTILYFYPRPPRGGRQYAEIYHTRLKLFLSTPSARRATAFTPLVPRRKKYFYPRPPRGGRQQKQRQNLYFLINYTTFCTNLEEP